MEQVLSQHTASISEFKKSPTKVMAQAQGDSVAILNHNRISGYFVPVDVYQKLLDTADNYLLSQEVKKRLNDNTKPIEVSLNEL